MDEREYAVATVYELHHALKNGEITALELLFLARERIAKLDKNGPRLNAVLEINPEAEALAQVADAEIRASGLKSPLHGIPVLVKDNIDTADSMHTSAGSLALQNRFAPKDAFIVRKLREAGAIILGKANMTELANYMTKNMPNGYSSRGGQVRHPWGEGLDPSGSSTGSAVAVAAGYVPIAIGTETFGSIISPSCSNGIVGIKPSVGVVSRSGIIPISITQDTAGPMGRTVLDCAMTLDVIADVDATDAYTLHQQKLGGYADAVNQAPANLNGKKLGVFIMPEEKVSNRFEQALKKIEALGATVERITLPFPSDEDITEILNNEFEACMNAALKGSINSPTTLKEIRDYNTAYPEACLKYGQYYVEKAVSPEQSFSNPNYVAVRRRIMEKTVRVWNDLFHEHNLSALITPDCSYFAIAGFPSVAIQLGEEAGKPVPLVLNGLAFSERTLLEIAAVIERDIATFASPSFD